MYLKHNFPSQYNNHDLESTLVSSFKVEEAKKFSERMLTKLRNINSTVLIVGESGTGKSEMAKNIHYNSKLKNQPYVEVHCTTLPHHLLESELFGHEKGAFTGAVKTKRGKVEEAKGGTLFLDEIGELSLKGQAKLLRLLQDKTFSHLGSNQEVHTDARILLATNKNLSEMVKEGTFREDLYYRINMFEVSMKPLRERKEEIPHYTKLFINKFCQDENVKKSFYIGDKLSKTLTNYNWPGNIRELKNTIERLCFLAEEEALSFNNLPERIKASQKINCPVVNAKILNLPQKHLSLEEMEKEHIKRVLLKTKNLSQAAKILGITKVTLWRKRKKFKL